MQTLARQKCFNHALREAVARCPECHRYFCRECISEYDDRVVCASCLKSLVQPKERNESSLGGLFRVTQSLVGILTLWLFYYFLGQGLLRLPTSFHEGTVWQIVASSGK